MYEVKVTASINFLFRKQAYNLSNLKVHELLTHKRWDSEQWIYNYICNMHVYLHHKNTNKKCSTLDSNYNAIK